MQAGVDAMRIFIQWNTAGDRTDQVADQANCDFTPFNETFHQCWLFVAFEDVAQLRAKFFIVVQDGLIRDAHASPFTAGFDEQWVVHTLLQWFIFALKGLKFGRGQVVPGENALGHGFVERKRERQYF